MAFFKIINLFMPKYKRQCRTVKYGIAFVDENIFPVVLFIPEDLRREHSY